MNSPRIDSNREFIERAVRWGIILVIVAAVLIGLLWVLKSVLTPLIIAFTLAYILDPLIDRFEARKIPRPAAIFFLVIMSTAVALAGASFLLPKLSQEITGLSARLPQYIDGVIGAIGSRLELWFGLTIPGSIREWLDGLRSGGFSLPLARVYRVRAVAM